MASKDQDYIRNVLGGFAQHSRTGIIIKHYQ